MPILLHFSYHLVRLIRLPLYISYVLCACYNKCLLNLLLLGVVMVVVSP